MPTYQYACTACDHRFEAVQSFSDDALTECPECGGKVRKVFSSVGIVFKGSGFYRTDSRSGTSSVSSGSSSNGEGSSSSSDSKSESKSDSKASTSSSGSSSTGSSGSSSTSTPAAAAS